MNGQTRVFLLVVFLLMSLIFFPWWVTLIGTILGVGWVGLSILEAYGAAH